MHNHTYVRSGHPILDDAFLARQMDRTPEPAPTPAYAIHSDTLTDAIFDARVVLAPADEPDVTGADRVRAAERVSRFVLTLDTEGVR